MVNNYSRLVTISVILMALLAGCAQQDIAWNATNNDAIGVWEVQEDVPSSALLRISEDETFEVTGFPKNLMCSGDSAAGAASWWRADGFSKIDWQKTMDFSGTWSRFQNYNVVLHADLPCNGGTTAQLWSDLSANGTLQLRFYLNGFDDEFNFVSFTKVSDGSPKV